MISVLSYEELVERIKEKGLSDEEIKNKINIVGNVGGFASNKIRL